MKPVQIVTGQNDPFLGCAANYYPLSQRGVGVHVEILRVSVGLVRSLWYLVPIAS